MDEQPIATITAGNLGSWLVLGLPTIVFWAVGGLGALNLLSGLAAGSVSTPSPTSLSLLWGGIVLLSIAGIALGVSALFRRIPLRWLVLSLILGFFSLFFTVLPMS